MSAVETWQARQGWAVGYSYLRVFADGPRRRPLAEADRQPVPGVHHGDDERQVDQLLVGEGLPDFLVRRVRHARLGDHRDGFRPGQGGPFSLVVEGRLAP